MIDNMISRNNMKHDSKTGDDTTFTGNFFIV